jgi:hypothetical protein
VDWGTRHAGAYRINRGIAEQREYPLTRVEGQKKWGKEQCELCSNRCVDHLCGDRGSGGRALPKVRSDDPRESCDKAVVTVQQRDRRAEHGCRFCGILEKPKVLRFEDQIEPFSLFFSGNRVGKIYSTSRCWCPPTRLFTSFEVVILEPHLTIAIFQIMIVPFSMINVYKYCIIPVKIQNSPYLPVQMPVVR